MLLVPKLPRLSLAATTINFYQPFSFPFLLQSVTKGFYYRYFEDFVSDLIPVIG